MTSSLLTLGDHERSKSKSPRFQGLISGKGADLGPMLPWWESGMLYIYFTVVLALIGMSTYGSLLAGGVFCCPSGLSCYT